MRIDFDVEHEIGSILLQETVRDDRDKHSNTVDTPVADAGEVNLEALKLSELTYRMALRQGILFEEYFNDTDDQGFMTCIELDLSNEDVAHLQAHSAVARTQLAGRPYRMLMLDTVEQVLVPSNRLFRVNDEWDAFIVVRLDSKIVAVATARDDIYSPAAWTTLRVNFM